jgi:hypothetical protein
MRLYATVAVLTFLGSFAVYTATQMSGVASAIGDGRTGSYAELFRNFNPLALLQRERMQAMVSSGEGIPRMEPFRSNFDASATFRALQPPKITIDTRRTWTPQPIRVPQVYTPPVYRPYR